MLYSKLLGNVLALAGIIQLSDWDEYAYHEMAAHLPMFAHPNPKNVPNFVLILYAHIFLRDIGIQTFVRTVYKFI